MDFKKQINETLDQIEKLTGEGSAFDVRKEVNAITDYWQLFRYHQTLRESLAEMTMSKEGTAFIMKGLDGKDIKFNNLKELDAYLLTRINDQNIQNHANISMSFTAMETKDIASDKTPV